MLVTFGSNANILHFLSIKELIHSSSTHAHIPFGSSMEFHNEIFAFIMLSAVKNTEKLNMAKTLRQHFWVQNDCFLCFYLQVFPVTSPVKEVTCKLVLLAFSFYNYIRPSSCLGAFFDRNSTCCVP